MRSRTSWLFILPSAFSSFNVPPARSSAARPATWGDAMDVPLKTEYVLLGVVERMFTPGAERPTSGPVLEKLARVPLISTAATAITWGYFAG